MKACLTNPASSLASTRQGLSASLESSSHCRTCKEKVSVLQQVVWDGTCGSSIFSRLAAGGGEIKQCRFRGWQRAAQTAEGEPPSQGTPGHAPPRPLHVAEPRPLSALLRQRCRQGTG